jgi:hypothetical protein
VFNPKAAKSAGAYDIEGNMFDFDAFDGIMSRSINGEDLFMFPT